MNPLANLPHSASTLLRSLLAIAFVLWLTMIQVQYEKKSTEKALKIHEKQAVSQIVINQIALPPVPKPESKLQEPEAQAQKNLGTKEQELKHTTKDTKQSVTPPAPQKAISQQQVEHLYQQLSEQGVDIQIAWPRESKQRQAALRFMYQCAGMQFAVLNDSKITTVKQLTLTDYSDWIRVAHGRLSKKEQHWITAYALTGKAIRLFPKTLDLRLAHHIATHLNGSPLVNFRANYQVTHQGLILNNIQLNDQGINGSWSLFQSKCEG